MRSASLTSPCSKVSSTASMTPLVQASASTSGWSQPVIRSASPFFRAHKANDPPINPSPTTVICLNCILNSGREALSVGYTVIVVSRSASHGLLYTGCHDSIHGLSDQSQPLHQVFELLR